MSSFVEMRPTRQDTFKRGQNSYLKLGKNRAGGASGILGMTTRVRELAMQIEGRSLETQDSVRVHVETIPVTQTKNKGVLKKKGFETDNFGLVVGILFRFLNRREEGGRWKWA